MATFPSIKPASSATKASRPNYRTTRFGDGYEQRVNFGLNTNPKQWSLTFAVKNADADTIENFLDARAADGQSFTWTPPDTTTAYKWVCQQYDKEVIGPNFNIIKASFRQVFEP